MTLSVRDAARTHPDRPALACDGRTWTYRELADRAEAVELDPIDPVPIVGAIDVETIVAIFAALERRRSIVLLHPRWTADERSRFVASIIVRPDAQTCAIFATSGSTGRPKAVELTRQALLAAASASESNLGWRDGDRWKLTIPPAHVGGFSILVRCLAARRTITLDDDPTILSVVPTQLGRMILEPPPSGLRAVLVGGAPLPAGLRQAAIAAGWPIRATYGLTESCAQVATQASAEDPGVGRPLTGVEVKVEDGEILVRGGTLLRRYASGEAAPTDEHGWLHTGDLGRIDGEGYLHVDGRADDLIISGGENVFPAEVEDALRRAGARDAVVFSEPDHEWGAMVAAAIVGVPPRPEVLDMTLARFKRPRRIAVLDAFPKTPVGKVDRRAVERLARPSLVPW